MTARIASQQSSDPQDSAHTNQQEFQNQAGQQPADFDEYYVPEREFVLMPLFRRIGRMLGFKQSEEVEYIYAPQPGGDEFAPAGKSPDQLRTAYEAEGGVRATAPLEQAATEDFEAAQAVVETHYSAPPEVAEAYLAEENDRGFSPTQDILGIEPEPEPEAVSQMTAAEQKPAPVSPLEPIDHESAVEPVLHQQMHEGPAGPVAVDAQHQDMRAEVIPLEAVTSPQEPETLVAAAVVSEVQVAEPAALSRTEAGDIANQIREAATKISAAIAQAAEWLHTKETEIMRRAEMPLTPERRIEQEPAMRSSGGLPVASEREDAVTEAELSDVPALQRERAWQDEKIRPFPVASPAATQRSAKVEKKRARLVNASALLASWRRIDWERQFAPKRIAIFGGALMAILMVLGISFARRPASSDLPQQTRAIEPGGVTLTTHPQVAPSAPVVQSQRKPTAVKATVEPRKVRRSADVDSEPDVVTHYYNQKAKPSPSHPATVAGVKHYSDMQ